MAPRIYLKWSWYYSGKFRFEREDALRADSADSTTKWAEGKKRKWYDGEDAPARKVRWIG